MRLASREMEVFGGRSFCLSLRGLTATKKKEPQLGVLSSGGDPLSYGPAATEIGTVAPEETASASAARVNHCLSSLSSSLGTAGFRGVVKVCMISKAPEQREQVEKR